MPKLIITEISGKNPDISVILDKFIAKNVISIISGIFSPLGEPILLGGAEGLDS